MTKTTITRTAALTAAIALLEADHQAEAAHVLRNMRETISKPRKADNSKRELNSRLAREVCALFAGKGHFTNADVRAAVNGPDFVGSNGTVTAQKVTAVLRQGIADGLISQEIVGSGKTTVTFYTVA